MAAPSGSSRHTTSGSPDWSAARAIWRLQSLRNRLEPAVCPVCGKADRRILLRWDRYLLTVDIAVCHHCGCVYCSRQLSAADADMFYEWVYPGLMADRSSTSAKANPSATARSLYRLRRMRAVIGPLDDILEIGCGSGDFLAACADAGIGALHGVEPGATSAAFARTRSGLADAIDARPLLQAAAPPFAPRIVAMFHVLEHFADPAAALRRLADWISPDGWLVLEVPDILGEWGKLGVQNFHLSHRSYFSAETLTLLLHQTGFRSMVIEREAGDFIYPGNLRVFARRRGDADPVPVAKPDVGSIAQHVQRLAQPWSLRHGYPRSVIRLARLALGLAKPRSSDSAAPAPDGL